MSNRKAPTRTLEELRALPVGSAFSFETRVIEGKTVRVPVMCQVGVVWQNDDEPFMWQGDDGDWWKIGQYADGTLFRERT